MIGETVRVRAIVAEALDHHAFTPIGSLAIDAMDKVYRKARIGWVESSKTSAEFMTDLESRPGTQLIEMKVMVIQTKGDI